MWKVINEEQKYKERKNTFDFGRKGKELGGK